MAAGELVGNTRNLALGALGKPKALTLIFLGIRKTRVDRQNASRITVARGVRHQKALARGPPQVSLHAARSLVLTQQLAITYETVTSQLNLAPVRGLAPLIKRHGGFDHVFALKQTLGTFVPQHVQSRIHLATHGVGKNTKLAAHASLPRRPGASVKCRHAQQRHVGTARQTLSGRDANANARKRTRAASNHITADIAAIQPGLCQHAIDGIHKFHVGMATAQMVPAHQLRLARLLINPACRAGKHVGRSIERHYQRVVVMQAHLVQPYQSNRKAPSRARRAPRARSFARRYRPHRA